MPVNSSVQIIYHIESYRIWFRHDTVDSKQMSVTAECNRQTNDCREYNIRQTKHTNSWPVIMWTLSDISNTSISFCLRLKTTPCTHKICTSTNSDNADIETKMAKYYTHWIKLKIKIIAPNYASSLTTQIEKKWQSITYNEINSS